MTDYRHVFGEKVALGLGLGQPPLLVQKDAIAEYRNDPATAFSRMAEMMQPPGNAIPLPFVQQVQKTMEQE